MVKYNGKGQKEKVSKGETSKENVERKYIEGERPNLKASEESE